MEYTAVLCCKYFWISCEFHRAAHVDCIHVYKYFCFLFVSQMKRTFTNRRTLFCATCNIQCQKESFYDEWMNMILWWCWYTCILNQTIKLLYVYKNIIHVMSCFSINRHCLHSCLQSVQLITCCWPRGIKSCQILFIRVRFINWYN